MLISALENTPNTPRRYTTEERDAAVALVAVRGLNAAAHELGIPRTTIADRKQRISSA